MTLIVTAIVPSSLADDIATKLATVFDGESIAAAKDGLSPATIAGDLVYCFSGQFTNEQLNQLNALGLNLPGITFWVQDSTTGAVLMSSKAEDVGSTSPAALLIRSCGVTQPSLLAGSANPL